MLETTRIFIKVVELGSFSKAGKVLNMAPSSVARNIDRLEEELSVTLLERSTRLLKLTDKGETFYASALTLVQEADRIKLKLIGQEKEVEGRLRVSVFESFGRLHVCPIITEFLAQYPKVELDIELENQTVDLYSDDVDLAIRIGAPRDSGLKARLLLPNHTVVCASPEYFERCGKPEAPNDIETHNCLLLNRNRRRTYWFFHYEKFEQKVQVKGSLRSSGGTPLIAACLSGLGIIQISKWMVDDYLKNGELEQLFPEWTVSLNEKHSGDIYALYKPSSYPNAAVRIFIDFLVDRIGSTI